MGKTGGKKVAAAGTVAVQKGKAAPAEPEYDNMGNSLEFRPKLRPRNEGEDLKLAETVLRPRDRNLEAFADRAHKVAAAWRERKKAQAPKREVTTAQYFVKRSRQRVADQRRTRKMERRAVKLPKLLREETEDGVRAAAVPEGEERAEGALIVVRNPRHGASKRTEKALKQMQLIQANTAVFIRHSEANVKRLRGVEAFIYWGIPSAHIVSALLHKRAAIRLPSDNKRHPLSDNALIEDLWGEEGLLCVEDVQRCIVSAAPLMEQVVESLFPFALADVRKTDSMHADVGHEWGRLPEDRLEEIMHKTLG